MITCPVGRARARRWPRWPRPGRRAGAVPLGLHLEGPMLAPGRRGAHPAAASRPRSPALIDGWSPAGGVALVTLAPELPGALDRRARSSPTRGVVVSIGHTDGTAAEFAAASQRRASLRHPPVQRHGGPSPTATPARSAPPSPTTSSRRAHLRRRPRRPGRGAARLASLGPARLTSSPTPSRRSASTAGPVRLGGVTVTAARRCAHRRRRARRQHAVARPGRAQPRGVHRVLAARRRGHGDRRRRPRCSAWPIAARSRPGVGPTWRCSTADLPRGGHGRRRWRSTRVEGRGVEVVIVADRRRGRLRRRRAIAGAAARRPGAVLGLATGSSPLAGLRRLIGAAPAGELSFARASAFLLDEYVGLPAGPSRVVPRVHRRELDRPRRPRRRRGARPRRRGRRPRGRLRAPTRPASPRRRRRPAAARHRHRRPHRLQRARLVARRRAPGSRR